MTLNRIQVILFYYFRCHLNKLINHYLLMGESEKEQYGLHTFLIMITTPSNKTCNPESKNF
uniref:Uncharacterized protein n=1 Tax=Rhizophora mucronata TaxID=61149 RepID=A0A2P2N3Y5_RHIMU